MRRIHQDWLIIILVIIAFTGCYALFRHSGRLQEWLIPFISSSLLRSFIIYLVIGIPVFMATILIHRDYRILRYLGCDASVGLGMWVAFLFALPMLAGGALFFQVNEHLSTNRLIKASLFAGLFEEL